MGTEEFQIALAEKTKEIEEVIKEYLPEEEGFQKTVMEAMNYSMLSGGKRIRPLLMLETFRMFGGKGKVVNPFFTALEMIHTYSLVHDDLPAMDDDEMRRGRKTTHVVYGEAMGILAGDALLNYAFETAHSAFSMEDGTKMYAQMGKALQVLSKKSGIYGMIGGQTVDIEAEKSKSNISKEQLLFIHGNKTAALIQAAMMVCALLAGASEEQVKQMETCAYHIGIAFQIQDDILDVTGDEKELGKKIGSDAKNEKQTYVTQNGLERAAKEVEMHSGEAILILQEIAEENEFMIQLVEMLIHRIK